MIISDVAGHKELPHELHEQIIRKADGVPLFAEELTKTMLESGLLQDARERYVTVGAVPPFVSRRSVNELSSVVGMANPVARRGRRSTRKQHRLGPIREIAQIGTQACGARIGR
jgi:hypothetical protein